MQTPAEKQLIETIASFLQKDRTTKPVILNIGAGKSLGIEDTLIEKGCTFICDRLDIESCSVKHQNIRNCYQCSVEYMYPIKSNEYDLAFSNYVLEHIENLFKASSEIYRILKPGGIYVASVSNPTAIEFFIAKRTPLWFHKWITGRNAWETHYSYKNIDELSSIFYGVGLQTIKVSYYPGLECFMERFFFINKLAYFYDNIISSLKLIKLMNQACVVFKKQI